MYGFVKIGAAIPKLHVADCIFNQQEILSLIHQAQEKNIKVLSFPELALTGYTCGDLFSSFLCCKPLNTPWHKLPKQRRILT